MHIDPGPESHTPYTLQPSRGQQIAPRAYCPRPRITHPSHVSGLILWPQGPANGSPSILSPDQNQAPLLHFRHHTGSRGSKRLPQHTVTGPESHTLGAFPAPYCISASILWPQGPANGSPSILSPDQNHVPLLHSRLHTVAAGASKRLPQQTLT